VPKQTFTLNDFSGGLNTVKDPRDIAMNEMSAATNIMVDKQGAIRTVGKWVAHSTVQSQAATLSGGYGIAILESDYETEPISITGASDVDFASIKLSGATSLTGGNGRYITRSVFNSDMAKDGDELTVTTGAAHGISAGDSIFIDGTSSDHQEGVYTVDTVPSTTTYTVESLNANIPSSKGATFHRLGLAVAASGGGTGFVNGSEILVTGTSNNNGYYTVKSTRNSDSQLIVQKDLTAEVGTSAVVKSLPKEDYILLLSDANNGKIDTYSKNRDTWTADQITIDSTGGKLSGVTKPVYYSVDNAVRASDANFALGNNTQWFGFIKRTHFEGCEAEDKYLDWFEKDNKLSPPTDGAVGTGYPVDNVGFDLNIGTPANTDSLWTAGTYQVASTFIYDGNQESLLFEYPSSTHDFEVAEGDSVTISVHAHTSATGYNPRISGARIYTKIDGSDDPWFLLCDIDMRRGGRATLDGDYIAWTNGTTSATDIDTGTVTSLSQNIDTYESLNGYAHDVESNSLGDEGEQWKNAVVANRRAFLAGVRRIDVNTGLHTTYGDRIYYSEIGRYDTFPSHNYIDAVLGDSESYIGIQEYADRLLAFKENSVQIINVASSSDSGWFLEENLKFHGIRHPSAATKTQYGIAWINDSGCYLYNGRRVVNLIDDKIDDDEWASFIGVTETHASIIGYERHKKQLIIMKDCTATQSDSGDAYIYDFKTKAWVKLINAIDDSYPYSNFVHDWNGDLLIAAQDGSDVDTYKWDSDDTSTKSDISFTTKDIDFGNPSAIKKIYKAYITYKSDGAETTPFTYAVDGKGNFSGDGGGTFTGNFANTSSKWDVLTITPSSTLSVQSLQLKFTGPTAGLFDINDVSIEYRPIHKKVS